MRIPPGKRTRSRHRTRCAVLIALLALIASPAAAQPALPVGQRPRVAGRYQVPRIASMAAETLVRMSSRARRMPSPPSATG